MNAGEHTTPSGSHERTLTGALAHFSAHAQEGQLRSGGRTCCYPGGTLGIAGGPGRLDTRGRRRNYWLVSSGTNEDPEVHDDWRPRHARWIERYGNVWQFGRRLRIAPGDRLVTYAVGSAHASGTGRVFSLCEVTSDAEPGECERWLWKVELRYLAGVPLLSQSPTLDDIAVSPLSVRRQTHIVLTPDPGRRAEELITARHG